MKKEIERKFLVKSLPRFNTKPTLYERYYVYSDNKTEVRVQKKGSKYEFERKVKKSDLSRENIKFEISKEEFEAFKKFSSSSILRESYLVQEKNPNITVKVYKGNYAGLVRAEVEFSSESEAKKFNPLPWFGKEITNSELGKDSKLIKLTKPRFTEVLKNNLV